MGTRSYDEEFTPQSPWLDLVNSEQWDGFGNLTDHLRDPDWVTRFLEYWKVDPDELGGGSPRARLTKLRDLLRRSTEKLATGRSLTSQDLEALNEFLDAPGYLQLVTERGNIRTELQPVRRNWKWIRSRIAASFAESVQVHSDRIKVCANELCRWAFVDATRSNIRKWCRDRRCGNRDRVRRARARSSD